MKAADLPFGKFVENSDLETKDRIVVAALKLFARRGYSATSIQDIVTTAQVTKPALYYYFPSKAALYQTLVDKAHEERFTLMVEAMHHGDSFREKLIAIIDSRFAYLKSNRDLMRIAYATAFAAEEELPPEIKRLEKAIRNFDFLVEFIHQAQQAGELDLRYDYRDLAFAIHGQINMYIMHDLLQSQCLLGRRAAERIVDLFLAGAAPKPMTDTFHSKA